MLYFVTGPNGRTEGYMYLNFPLDMDPVKRRNKQTDKSGLDQSNLSLTPKLTAHNEFQTFNIHPNICSEWCINKENLLIRYDIILYLLS